MTTEHDFTDGPWSACKDGECSCGFIWDGSGQVHVATAHDSAALGRDYYGSDTAVVASQRAANARLIACAPELFSLLKQYRYESSGSGRVDVLFRLNAQADALIAKATGAK